MSVTETVTAPSEATTDDDLVHLVCGRDDVTTLCGTKVPRDWVDEDENCVVCIDLCDNHPAYCPLGGVCPGGNCEGFDQ